MTDPPPADWDPVGPDTGLEESMRRLGLLSREVYPERVGVAECAYFMRTGTCGYGNECRFHHPRDRSYANGTWNRPYSNRPSPEMVYDLRTYGIRGVVWADKESTSYNPARPPVVPGSYVSGAYGPLLLHPGMVPLPNWGPYSGPVSPVMSPGTQPSVVPTSLYRMAQMSSSTHGFAGPYAPVLTSAGPSRNNRTMHAFPDRPGQPECQFYMKTGDCKFGSSCKYHDDPPDWVVSRKICVLSHIGLPLHPGVQPCSFYMQNRYCKFGQTCKFDHPVEASNYNPSASLANMAVAPYMLPSSPINVTPISFPEFISGPKLDSITT